MKQRVILALEGASALGRGALQGVVDYAHAHEDWQFEQFDEVTLKSRRRDVSPQSAAAIIGVIRPDLADLWDGNNRRFVVNISRAQGVAGCANITVDDRAIAVMAADFLTGKGVQSFAFVGPPDSGDRGQTFRSRLERSGRSVHDLVTGDSGNIEALASELQRLPNPCGILAFNDIVARQVIELAQDVGLGVPRDIAVLGVDNDVFLSAFSPVLVSSIAIDFSTVGYRAGQALGAVFRGEPPPRAPIRIPPIRVIERESTDFVGQQDWLAVQTAREIRRRACTPAKIPEMLSEISASYRTIARRFQRAFGRTLQDEITRVRMAKACRLLTTTNLPLHAIAEQTGYRDPNYFNSTFSRHKGIPPAAYRREQQAPACPTPLFMNRSG
jgi:LacI family transcriptional regulator